MRSPARLASTTVMFESVYGPSLPAADVETDPWAFCYAFGIWDRRARMSAAAALRAHPPAAWGDVLVGLGFSLPPQVQLPTPARPIRTSAFARLHGAVPPKGVIWPVVRATDWGTRSLILRGWLQDMDSVEPGVDRGTLDAMLAAVSLRWTACLEHVQPEPIGSIQAAGCLLATTHREWIAAANEWIEPFRATWWALWLRERPEIEKLVRLRRASDAELPHTGARANG